MNEPKRPRPTVDRLRELLNYDPETGVLTWLINPRGGRSRVKLGDQAGSLNKRGYRYVGIDGHRMRGCIVAFTIYHGRYPTKVIDHDDNVPSNDRIKNLIEAGSSANNRNAVRVGKSGYRGVFPNGGAYIAAISENKKFKYLGRSRDPAVCARIYDTYVTTNHGTRFPTNASLGLLK